MEANNLHDEIDMFIEDTNPMIPVIHIIIDCSNFLMACNL